MYFIFNKDFVLNSYIILLLFHVSDKEKNVNSGFIALLDRHTSILLGESNSDAKPPLL